MTAATDRLVANAPPSTCVVPTQNPFYFNLAPSVSAVVSTRQGVSPQSASLSLARFFSPTPPNRTVALPEDADTAHSTLRLSPQRSAQIPTSNPLFQNPPYPTPWSPVVPSSLRDGSSRPFFPPSSFTSQTVVPLLHQIASTTPCLVNSLLLANFADGCALQGDAPGLKLLPRHYTPLYFTFPNKAFFAGLSGTGAQKL